MAKDLSKSWLQLHRDRSSSNVDMSVGSVSEIRPHLHMYGQGTPKCWAGQVSVHEMSVPSPHRQLCSTRHRWRAQYVQSTDMHTKYNGPILRWMQIAFWVPLRLKTGVKNMVMDVLFFISKHIAADTALVRHSLEASSPRDSDGVRRLSVTNSTHF